MYVNDYVTSIIITLLNWIIYILTAGTMHIIITMLPKYLDKKLAIS